MERYFKGQMLADLSLRPITCAEQECYREQLAGHHYLGDLPKIGETLWYVATWRRQQVAQLSLCAETAALKCRLRERWIGRDLRTQYYRLKLIANNSRFVVPGLEPRRRALPQFNRGHWSIETVEHFIDWNYDEDRRRIRTGHGRENITRLRRFAAGVLTKLRKPNQSIAQMMRQLCFRPPPD